MKSRHCEEAHRADAAISCKIHLRLASLRVNGLTGLRLNRLAGLRVFEFTGFRVSEFNRLTRELANRRTGQPANRPTGKHANWQTATLRNDRAVILHGLRALIFLLAAVISLRSAHAVPSGVVLSDFETADQTRVRWVIRDSVITRSSSYASSGNFSAKVFFRDYPSPKVTLSGYLRFSRERRDWSFYKTLAADFYNPYPFREELGVQLKDRAGRAYREQVVLPASSAYAFKLRLSEVGEKIDLKNIIELTLFRWNSGGEVSFYLDSIRLELEEASSQPILRRPVPAAVVQGKRGSAAPVPGARKVSAGAAVSPIQERVVPAPTLQPADPAMRKADDGDADDDEDDDEEDQSASVTRQPFAQTFEEESLPPELPPPALGWKAGWTISLNKLSREPQEFTGRFNGPVQISLAGGEAEAFQIVLIGGEKPANVQVSVGDLQHALSGAVFPPESVEISEVGYVRTNTPYYPADYTGDWPDPLMKTAGRIQIPPKKVQPVWVSIRAPRGAVAGRYQGIVTITDGEGGRQEFQIHMRVWNFTLPEAPNLKTAFDFYRFRLDKAYREFMPADSRWASRLDDLQKEYFLSMLDRRLSPVWGADPGDPAFPDEAKLYLSKGMSVFGIGQRGGNFGNNWPAGRKELKETMDWYAKSAGILKSLGLLGRAYVYTYDEPQPGDARVAEVMAAVHGADPGLKNLLVMHEAPDPDRFKSWLKEADILCVRNAALSTDLVWKYKKLGKEVWMYVSSPSHPYPTLVIDYPAVSARILPWMCWKSGVTGLLYWCVNFWEGDPMKNPSSFAKDQNGNGFLFYPGVEGPVSSIRLESLRDGMEDYEYLYLLQELVNAVRAKGRSNPSVENQAYQYLMVEPALVESLRGYSKNPEILLNQRKEIAEMIEKLQALLAG